MVVIAVIGILAGLLLPVLSKAKDQGTRNVCVNNLKQINLAMHVYATDHADELPWSNWFKGDTNGRAGWLYKLDTTKTGPARFVLTNGVFWAILQNPKMYMCPLDHPGTELFKNRDQQISSYVMNGAVNGYKRILQPTLRLNQMPVDGVAYWETDESEPKYFNDGASRPDEGVSPRHNQGAIMSRFGGTVEFIKLKAYYDEEALTNKNKLWCYPNSPDGR